MHVGELTSYQLYGGVFSRSSQCFGYRDLNRGSVFSDRREVRGCPLGGGKPKTVCLTTERHESCAAAATPVAQVSPCNTDLVMVDDPVTACATCRVDPLLAPFDSRDLDKPLKLVWCTHNSFIVCITFNYQDPESRSIAASFGQTSGDELWFEIPHGPDAERTRESVEALWAEWDLCMMPTVVNPAKRVTYFESEVGEDLRELRYFLRDLGLEDDALSSYYCRDPPGRLPIRPAHSNQSVVNT